LEFQIKRRTILLQVLMIVFFASFLLVYPGLYTYIIGTVFILFFGKDTIKLYRRKYRVTDDALEILKGDTVDRRYPFKDMTMLTLTQKNRRWVVAVFGEDMVTLKPAIEDRRQLLQAIVERNRKNRNFLMHEDLVTLYALEAKVNEDGKLIG
jgi:UPF0716 family protein affecting phage T7 exclusion